MSRLFDGVDDLMTYAQPASTNMNDALSLMMVVKIATTSDNTWLSFMEFDRGGGGNSCGMVRTPSSSIGELGMINTSGTTIGSAADVSISDADGWMILVITRSTAAASNLHKIPIGGSRTSQAGSALADGLAWNSVLKVGGDEDWANMYWAAGAYWNGTELNTTQIDSVATAKTTQSIADLSPTWLADDSDAFATNLINPGVGDRTAIVGTTDSADDPSGWVYFGGGGAAVIPSLVMAPPIPA